MRFKRIIKENGLIDIDLLGKGVTQEINGDGGSIWSAPDDFGIVSLSFELMHQSIPAVPIPPPGNHGAFAQMSVPGVGH